MTDTVPDELRRAFATRASEIPAQPAPAFELVADEQVVAMPIGARRRRAGSKT